MGLLLFLLGIFVPALGVAGSYPDAAAIGARASDLSSVEEFLDWLGRDYPRLLSDFTLMRRSGSTQGASPRAPRVIAFSDDARFVFAFQGDPALPGHDAVEMFHFVDGRFEFRELRFGGGKARLSEANPGKCRRCHFSPTRPIWDNYPEWDGAYGGFDDAIYAPGVEPIGPVREGAPAEMAREYAGFNEFRNARESHPRYRRLRPRAGTKMSPYSDLPRRNGEEFRPNLRLTKLLARLQGEALATRAHRDRECFERLAPAAIAALWECGSAGAFRESARQAANGARTRLRHLADGTSAIGLLRALGIDEADYALTRAPSWRYFQGVTMLDADAGDGLYALWRAGRPELPPFSYMVARREELYHETPFEAAYRPLCDRLLAEAGREGARLPAFAAAGGCAGDLGERAAPVQPPPTVRLCLSCHDGREPGAPFLALADRDAIPPDLARRALARIDASAPARRMPPDRALLERERTELRRWLRRGPEDVAASR